MDISFYEELFKSINDVDDYDLNECLISLQKLETDHVTLECGHKFNYKPIFDEVFRQKHLKSSYETQRLGKYDIKCPYCRNIQHSLLPPHTEMQMTYVNKPLHKCMKPHKCSYVFKNGVKKGTICNKPSFSDYCQGHIKILERKKNKKQMSKLEQIFVQDKNIKVDNDEDIPTIDATNDVSNFYKTCIASLVTGKNSGNICGKMAKYGEYCGIHKKYYNESI